MTVKKAEIRERFCFFCGKIRNANLAYHMAIYGELYYDKSNSEKNQIAASWSFFSQHFGMFNSMLENMIAVQKELVLERTYYMDDKMAYFMNMLIDEDDIKC